MDVIIRWLSFAAIGMALLLANYWFIRAVHKQFAGKDVVILPFSFAAGDDQEGQRGLALARLFGSRLASVQSDLTRLRPSKVAAPQKPGLDAADFNVLPLILPQVADIPASLFEPFNFSLSVGGVEVGGLLTGLRRLWVAERTLAFTVIPKSEDRVIVTADLAPLLGPRHRWFAIESDPRPDEIAANLAYAVVQRRVPEDRLVAISDLEPAQFRHLLEIVVDIARMNERVRAGASSERGFAARLPELEGLAKSLPNWHELTYLTARVAESAGDQRAALGHYERLWVAAADEGATLPETLRSQLRAKHAEFRRGVDLKLAERRHIFTAQAHAFARLMDLPGPDPEIVVGGKATEQEGVYAVWDTKQHRYEVNPRHAEEPGLPQYVALMGRFMAKHYDRCFGGGQTSSGEATAFWNEFRASVVAYLMRSVPEFAAVQFYPQFQSFSRVLQYMERANPDSVKRLALELLDQYDCDWTRERLRGEVERIDRERGLLLASVIPGAFASEPEWREVGHPGADG